MGVGGLVAEHLTQITTPTLVIVDERSAWWTDTIKVLNAMPPSCRLVAFGDQRVEYGDDRLLYVTSVRVWVNGSYRSVEARHRRTVSDNSRIRSNGEALEYARDKALSDVLRGGRGDRPRQLARWISAALLETEPRPAHAHK